MRKLIPTTNVLKFGWAACVAVLAVALIAVVSQYLIEWMDNYVGTRSAPERADVVLARAQALTAIVQVAGGAVLLIVLISTFYTAAQTARHTQEQLEIARAGQTAERFTKAIDQLGASRQKGEKNMEVRLGGIYALERVAADEPDRYHGTVMEVLSAYLRENSSESDAPPPTDIQAAITVIGRTRADEERRKKEPSAIDLSNVNLGRAQLRDAHLEGAVLSKTHLEGAWLNGAHLEGTWLNRAHLEGAWLNGAHLEGTVLNWAHLEGAVLIGAHLEGARLIDAHLEGARLNGAHLEGAGLKGAHLEGAWLIGAHLEGAWLGDAHLEGAMLSDAHLEGAMLDEATGLTQAQIDSACMDNATVLPSDPSPSGAPYHRSSRDCS